MLAGLPDLDLDLDLDLLLEEDLDLELPLDLDLKGKVVKKSTDSISNIQPV